MLSITAIVAIVLSFFRFHNFLFGCWSSSVAMRSMKVAILQGEKTHVFLEMHSTPACLGFCCSVICIFAQRAQLPFTKLWEALSFNSLKFKRLMVLREA